MEVISLIISIVSIIFAAFSLYLHYCNFKAAAPNIEVISDINDSFFFDAIDRSIGNRESLVVSARIINRSNQPIDVSEIQLVYNDQFSLPSTKVSAIPYPHFLENETISTIKDENGFLELKSINGDGYKTLDLLNNLIKAPLHLDPYGSVQGLLLFPIAGESKEIITLEVVTSRQNFVSWHKVLTKEVHDHLFEH